MSSISDQAVVLTRLDYSETSQVIVFFTRGHGKVRAIGKGLKRSTKKRFAVGIDLLDVGNLVVSVRHERPAGLVPITEWTQTRVLSGLREKLMRNYAALYASEITAKLTEDWDPHPPLFTALVDTLSALSEVDDDVLPVVVAYQRAVLEAAGSLPLFDVCTLCGRTGDLTHFSSFEGGMICRHCEPGQVEKREILPATLAILRDGAEHGTTVGPFGVLNYHISHLMGKAPTLADKLVPAARRRVVE